ncbi:sulfotransferase 1B1-like [Diadema antillarum]|uniref:sulfotransferase 1B1-like n=1 Tax=Diadema antillarum TaxID=105358 RepID=UPI003A866BCD
MAAQSSESPPEAMFQYCHDGIWYPTVVVKSSIEALRSFEVRPDDVWIITFPKSGTHWMTEIVALILNEGYPEKVDRTLLSSAAEMINMEQKFPTKIEDVGKVQLDMSPFLDVIDKAPSPRVILTHLQLNRLPRDMLKKAKAIYCVRNPKDVTTSWFNFMSASEIVKFKWEDNFEQFLQGKMHWGSWPAHVKQALDNKGEKNLLIVQYEELLRDPMTGIRKIAEHIGHPLSDEVLERVVTNSTLSQMKKTYHKLAESGRENLTRGPGVNSFLNKGKTGQWKTRFTVAQNEIFDKWYQKEMAGTNFNISFE